MQVAMITILGQSVGVAAVTVRSSSSHREDLVTTADAATNDRADRRLRQCRDRPSPCRRMTGVPTVLPRTGDVLRVTKAASVQFVRPMLFRVIRVHDWQTYDGWAWLDGYQLNTAGDAIERRSIFVQPQGLQPGFVKATQRVVSRMPVSA
jgi:hypothetical protein